MHTGKARGVLKPGTGTGNTTDITLLHNQRWLAHGNPSSCSLSLLFTNPRSARTTILRYICCTPAEQCTCSSKNFEFGEREGAWSHHSGDEHRQLSLSVSSTKCKLCHLGHPSTPAGSRILAPCRLVWVLNSKLGC